MPFKSKAQRRKFAELLVTGKITDEAYERWNKETGRKELPERVTPKEGPRRKARKRKTVATKRKVAAKRRPPARGATRKATTRKRPIARTRPAVRKRATPKRTTRKKTPGTKRR